MKDGGNATHDESTILLSLSPGSDLFLVLGEITRTRFTAEDFRGGKHWVRTEGRGKEGMSQDEKMRTTARRNEERTRIRRNKRKKRYV